MTSVVYLTDTRYGQQAWAHPSARHRCYHFADALQASGNRVAVLSLEQVNAGILEQFEHVIFHRPSFNHRFETALAYCQNASVHLHADYDDLIFNAEFARHSPLYVNRVRSLEKVERQFQLNQNAAACFDSFILSTRYLQTKILQTFPAARTTVLSNSLARLFVRPGPYVTPDSPLTIGYFPGSNGHGEDFHSVKSALKEIVGARVRLLVAGRLDRQYFDDIANVVQLPFADYQRYLQMLSCVDVSIAPLTDNEFNRSKSAVKLIESVSVGTPIVASSNADMRDHNNPMALLVSDQSDWHQSLAEALSLAHERRSNRIDMADTLVARYSVNARVPLLTEYLQCAA